MFDLIEKTVPASKGYCSQCQSYHVIVPGNAYDYAKELILELRQSGCLSENVSTDYLYSQARGQMFGVLEVKDQTGQTQFLKAFSGQYDGQWLLDGWVPPIVDIPAFLELSQPVEAKLANLKAKRLQTQSHFVLQTIKQEEKKLSQNLMKDLFQLYTIRNKQNRTQPVGAFFTKLPPTGTGECCAPKLLNYAFLWDYTPVSMAEFYWGKENRSQTRQEGRFYPACKDKCEPILGYMLCNMDKG